MGRSKRDRARLFSIVSHKRVSGYTMKNEKVYFKIRKLLTCKSDWTRLSREVTESRSLEIFKIWVYTTLTCSRRPCPEQQFWTEQFQDAFPKSAFLHFCELSLFECSVSRLQSTCLRHPVYPSFSAVDGKVKGLSLINRMMLMSPVANFTCLSTRGFLVKAQGC